MEPISDTVRLTRRTVLRSAATGTLLTAVGVGTAGTAAANGGTTVDLIADNGDGSGPVVGSVSISDDGMDLSITIETDGYWCLTETHVHVADSVGDVPAAGNGNPIPGRFDYSGSHDCVTSVPYTIPIPSPNDGTLVVAVHTVVETFGTLDYFAQLLPSTASVRVAFPGGDSYFNLTVSNAGSLDGTYDSFCIDTDRTISPGATYTADVYSSYESLPSGIVEFPENLDLVNYIINQSWPGKTSPGGYGTYTYGDVQRAIWTLIEDELSASGLGSWSQDRVNEILADAQANGEGFVPGCGDYVAVIFVPGNSQYIIGQVVLGSYPVPCEFREETAWGDGPDFAGRNWATYIEYTLSGTNG
ncbi:MULTISPECIES: hypothetical protein [Haloferax]|uniref:Uncharacterized protein n=2 Tax=Haloferax TaxID=2251 RepID=A0A6G1Z4D5_9EURY|nr:MULTISPECIES: hypothetical protein [Haloferax]KAB1188658.1 hypothetical protein Hfx1149_11665 [Haloferax sp. CBA1149]MRW81363.1 hypothetical protein [Haloferax marinisediminis]